MTQGIVVPPGEHGVVRLFHVSLSDAELAPLLAADRAAALDQPRAPQEPGVALVQRLLGVTEIEPRWTTLIRIADLGDLRLSDHLTLGEGLPDEVIAPDRARIDALEGHVLIVLSRAFGEAGAMLSPGTAVTLIGTWRMAPLEIPRTPLRSAGARGVIGSGTGPVPDPKRQSGMVALIALVVMLAVVGLVILIAG